MKNDSICDILLNIQKIPSLKKVKVSRILDLIREHNDFVKLFLFLIPTWIPIFLPPGISLFVAILLILYTIKLLTNNVTILKYKWIDEIKIDVKLLNRFVILAIRYVSIFEKYSKRRGNILFEKSYYLFMIKIFLFILSIFCLLTPLTNFFAGICMSIICFGMIKKDTLYTLLGIFFGILYIIVYILLFNKILLFMKDFLFL